MTTKKMMGLLAFAAPLVVSQAFAEIEGSVTAGYSSMYEFRGINLGDHMAEASVAASTEYNGITFGANIWYASTNDDAAYVENEVDYTLTASKEFGPVTATLGYIYYTYPDYTEGNTQEIFLSLGYELPYEVIVTGYAYYDFDVYDGWYLALDLGKSFGINDQLTLNLNAGLGSYQSYDGFADSYSNLYIKAALAWTPKENLTITPYIKFTDAADDYPADLSWRSGYPDFGGDNFIAGVTMSVAF